MAEVRTGTSGWSYPAWIGSFYPPGTRSSALLNAYAARLAAVEAHHTFRRLPADTTVRHWAAVVPSTFHFAPKAHVGITHRRDLEGLEDRVASFFDRMSGLGDHLGPVLFNLPHRSPDIDRLERILSALPRHRAGAGRPFVAAFELGPEWVTSAVLDRLEAHGCTVALVDTDDRPAPDLTVGPGAYVRLRRVSYSEGELDDWADRLAKLAAGDRPAYAFVRHDDDGLAPEWAVALSTRLAS